MDHDGKYVYECDFIRYHIFVLNNFDGIIKWNDVYGKNVAFKYKVNKAGFFFNRASFMESKTSRLLYFTTLRF